MHADRAALVQGGRQLLLICNDERRLGLYDIERRRLVKELPYDQVADAQRLDLLRFTDLSLVPDSPIAYLIGELRDQGLLARLNLETLTADAVLLDSPLRRPSIAASQFGRVVFGDMESSALQMIDIASLDWRTSGVKSRGELGRRIYLKDGPVADLGISMDGRLIVAAHAYRSVISLVDAALSEVVDRYESTAEAGIPLAIAVARSVSEGSPTSVVTASKKTRTLGVTEVSGHFQAFDRTSVASLTITDSASDSAPLLVTTSQGLEAIVVGSRVSPTLEIFRRVPGEAGAVRSVSQVSNAGGLERTNIVRLAEPPDGLSLSADGQVLSILLTHGRSARVIQNPVAWSSGAGLISGSDLMREAQRLLSALGYPIGTVDGLEGPRTASVVQAFKEAARLSRDGVVDTVTLNQMRQVAEELPGPTEVRFLSAGSGTAACREIESERQCARRGVTARPASKSYPEREVEEVVCAAVDGSLPVQVDRFSRGTPKPSYLCSGFHSCAFVRFRDIVAYESICQVHAPAARR